MSRYRILHVISNMDKGGAEANLMGVLRHYDRERYEMDICHYAPRAGAYADEVRALGARLFHVCRGYNLVRYVRQLTRAIRDGGYDALCEHTLHGGLSLLAARRAGLASRVILYHSTATLSHRGMGKGPYFRFQQYLARRCATRMLFVSGAVLAARYPKRSFDNVLCFHMPNGVELEQLRSARAFGAEARQLLKIPPDATVVGHCGSFTEIKNHRTIVAVARRVLGKMPDARFLLVGDGPLRPAIERQVDEAGIAGNFVFAGLRSDVPRMLSAMDVFLFPSLSEGLPVAMIEAMAAGLPVVSTDRPEFHEALPPVARQHLFPSTNDEALADDLMRLVADPAERRRLSAAGQAWAAEHYDINATVALFCKHLVAGCIGSVVERGPKVYNEPT